MLNKHSESRHLCLVPDLSGKAFNLSLLSMIFVVGFLYMTCIMMRYFPSVPNLLRVLTSLIDVEFSQVHFLYLLR